MSPEMYVVVTAGGVLLAAAVVALLALRLLKRIASYQAQIVRQEAMARDAADLLEQMDLLAKDLQVKLDERVKRVDQALAQADASIAHLRGEAPASGHEQPHLAAEAEAAGAAIWQPPLAIAATSQAPDEDFVTLPGTWPIPPAVTPPGNNDPDDAGADSLKGGKHREVSRLAQQGLDAVTIARRLNLDVGEVELVMNLGRKRA